jgi:hypothetical protein
MITILYPDALHIHERGFRSLIEATKNNDITNLYISEYDNIKALYGNYYDKKSLFLKYYDSLVHLSQDELYNYNYAGMSLFSFVQAEMLSYLMAQKNWYSKKLSSESSEIFKKAYKEDKETLLLNLAVALFWFHFWKDVLFTNKTISRCILFSGSLIYVKTLSFLLQNTPVAVFVVEHFFTGNDYYLEHKYTHIANNSDIKFNSFYNKLEKEFLSENHQTRMKKRKKSLSKIEFSKNKNVMQPAKSSTKLNINQSKNTVLILGQVINDFSILETCLENINSLDIYKQLITRLISESDYNIILKAHPWEKSKVNLLRSLTKDELLQFMYQNFSAEEQKRLLIVEDYNINELFEISDHIVGLCSQSLIEAALTGKKVHQFGNAFFGNKGFTYNYQNVNSCIEGLLSQKNSLLSIEEYNNLMSFLTITLEYHLVSVHNEGIKSVSHLLELPCNIEIKKNLAHFVAKDINTLDKSKNSSYSQRIISFIVHISSKEKKLKKFRSNPKMFFEDSKNPFIQYLSKYY